MTTPPPGLPDLPYEIEQIETAEATAVPGPWSRFGRYLVGLAIVIVLGYISYGRGEPVPILDQFDLGIHELGHMLTAFFGRTINILAGSVAQVLVPLGLAAYFLFGRKDLMAAGIILAWAGTSARDVSVYIADAPFGELQLLGNAPITMHDWRNLLSDWGMMDQAIRLAKAVRATGFVMVLGGAGLCIAGVFLPDLRERRRAAREAKLETHRASLPVRQPRSMPRGSGASSEGPPLAPSADEASGRIQVTADEEDD